MWLKRSPAHWAEVVPGEGTRPMPLFVFRFGYETSQVTAANEEHGWDDEFSEFVVIDAPDEEMASAWGCEVAERFVQTLGGKSWRAGKFAYWVDPLSQCQWASRRPPIAVGEFPDFRMMLPSEKD